MKIKIQKCLDCGEVFLNEEHTCGGGTGKSYRAFSSPDLEMDYLLGRIEALEEKVKALQKLVEK